MIFQGVMTELVKRQALRKKGGGRLTEPERSVSALVFAPRKRYSKSMELKSTLSSSFFRRFCPDPTVMYDLGDLYAELNARFFNGELPVLPSESYTDKDGETRTRYGTLKWDGRMRQRTLGTYKASSRRGHGTIRLARSIAYDPARTRSVLLHEMLHKYLDLKSMDDGILGHGENFVSEAKRINETCEKSGVEYRIHFYDEVVTRDEPFVVSELSRKEIYCGKDLDVARNMQAVMRAAFDRKFEYFQ